MAFVTSKSSLLIYLECTTLDIQQERIRGLLRQITSLGFKEASSRSSKSVYNGHDEEVDTANGNMSPMDKVPINFEIG